MVEGWHSAGCCTPFQREIESQEQQQINILLQMFLFSYVTKANSCTNIFLIVVNPLY